MTPVRSCLTLLILSLSLQLSLPLSAQKAASDARKSPSKKGPAKKAPELITTATGLKYSDTRVGTGPSPVKGQRCLVHYTGWLSDKGRKGKKFDSSLDRGEPLAFPVGVGRVIKGWDEGLMTMKVGGKRTLHIPARLGYGARGAGADIPPNADLIFEVELVGVQ